MGALLLLCISAVLLTASVDTGAADHGPALTDRLDALERLLETQQQQWQQEKLCCEKLELDWEENKRQWKARLSRELENKIMKELERWMLTFSDEQSEKERKWKRKFEAQQVKQKQLLTMWQKEKMQWEHDRQELAQTVVTLIELLKTKETVQTQNRDQMTRQAEPKNVLPDTHDVMSRADDVGSWEPVVAQMTQRLSQMSADVQAAKNDLAAMRTEMTAEIQTARANMTAELQVVRDVNVQQDQAIQESRASVFVRWGRTVCPSSDGLVYSGVVGGSWYDNTGSAANYLCLTLDPVLSDHPLPPMPGAYVHGGEYQTGGSHHNDDVPCAVCRAQRPATMMVPGTNQCPAGWTMEYNGYLMAGYVNHPAASEYVCVDSQFEDRPSGQEDENGVLMYFTVTRCGSLPCPPYAQDKIVTCAVCSK